jgi:hypothetical protein
MFSTLYYHSICVSQLEELYISIPVIINQILGRFVEMALRMI